MRKQQTNGHRRLRAVLLNLQKHESLFSHIPAMTRCVSQIENLLEQLDTVGVLQEKGSKPTTALKGTARWQLAQAILNLGGYLNTVGVEHRLDDLLVLTQLQETKLLKKPAERLHHQGTLLLEEARRYADELADEGYYESQIDEFEDLLTRFGELKDAPRSVIDDRKAATVSVPGILRQGTTLINRRLHGLMQQFKETEPVFYGRYLTSRDIKRVATRKEADTPADPSALAA